MSITVRECGDPLLKDPEVFARKMCKAYRLVEACNVRSRHFHGNFCAASILQIKRPRVTEIIHFLPVRTQGMVHGSEQQRSGEHRCLRCADINPHQAAALCSAGRSSDLPVSLSQKLRTSADLVSGFC